MAEPLKCAVCGVGLTVADADHAVSTDAGPVHRECYEGPLPPGVELSPEDQAALERAEEEAEEDARRAHNDVPLPPRDDDTVMLVEPKMAGDLPPHVTNEQVARYRALTGRFPCTPHSVAPSRGTAVHEAIAAAMEAPAISDECRERLHGDCPTYKPCGCPCHAPAPDDGLDHYDPGDERSAREQRYDDENFGRYSDDGRTY